MGIFQNILTKLGFGDEKKEAVTPPAAATATTAPAAPSAAAANAPAAAATPGAGTAAPSTPSPAAMTEVDVIAKLDGLASSHAEKLNWKTSIVDLMKLLSLDSSLTARKELATELGCPADKMSDSAQMNMWLHKTVLRKLAENGGNIPAQMLD